MAHNFCRYLTNGLRVQSWYGTLAAAPCCYLTPTRVDDPKFESDMDKYRSLENCYGCLHFTNGDVETPNYPPNRSKVIIPDVDHTHPVYAELAIDTKCNAACMSCGDYFSSYWQEQNKKFNIKSADEYPDAQNDEEVVENLFNKFDFSHLTELNFLGGEPLISQANLLTMERIVSMGIANNIEIRFTTNGSTRLTDRQVDLLSKFRRVVFTYSIDGVEDRFHYLRYPLKWDKFLSVIEFVRSIDSIPNLHYIINSTVSCLSAFYMDELDNWIKEYFKDDLKFRNAHTPPCTDIMSSSALPLEARLYLKDKYKDNPRISNQFNDSPDNVQAITQALKHFKLWDGNRNLDWKKTFPLAVPFYNNYLDKV